VTKWFVPGRIEVLGKHTDYAGGRSLVCAIDRGFRFVGTPSNDRRLAITRTDRGETACFPLDPELRLVEGEWSSFPAVVARRLARDFRITRGAELSFTSDLPVAAGLSSGSALTIGVFLALAEFNRLSEHPLYQAHLRNPESLAEYLGCLENGRRFGPFDGGGGVGTLGGCEDQAAITMSEPGRLKQFRFLPVRLERTVGFPPGYAFVIASSGGVAQKTGAARESYNAAARAAAEIHRLWQEHSGSSATSLGEALSHGDGVLDQLRPVLADRPGLRARLEQFVAETEEIIPAASDALEQGKVERFGQLVDCSQAGAESGLGNQVVETVHLQRCARAMGAVAASAFGAGFGGSVWAMIAEDQAQTFRDEWQADYLARFQARRAGAEFFVTQPGPGALRLPDR
jgi:galactokinase